MDSENNQSKAVTKPAGPSLASLAPAGIDGRLWVKTLKDNLLSQRSDGEEPTTAELMYFARVCQATGLDPAKREIYGIYRNVKQKDGTYKPKLSIQTSIDGFRGAAERSHSQGGSGIFGGSEEPQFFYNPDDIIKVNSNGTPKTVPNKATVTVRKIIAGQVYPTTRSANWVDYYPERDNRSWNQFPETMLAKVAEAQALRAAFPNVNGMYLEEEMTVTTDAGPGAENVDDITAKIKAAKTPDELAVLIQSQTPEVQKRLTALAAGRAEELLADDEPAPKPTVSNRKVVSNAQPAEPKPATIIKKNVGDKAAEGATANS